MSRFRLTLFSSLFFFVIVTLVTQHFAECCSRDYETYLNIIDNGDSPDLVFSLFVWFGNAIHVKGSDVYLLYLVAFLGLLFYYFYTRKVSIYWVSIYLLNFYTLHVVTQVRAGMAAVFVALVFTTQNKILTRSAPLAGFIHSSAFMFSGCRYGVGWLSRLLWSIIPILLIPLLSRLSDKYDAYALEINESQPFSVALLSLLLFTLIVIFFRIKIQEKIVVYIYSAGAILLYFVFLDFKTIPNRFLELTGAVIVLVLGAFSNQGIALTAFKKNILYLVVLFSSFFFFFYYNVVNSVLNDG